MPIKVRCKCGKGIKVRDSAAGKRVRCPECGKPVRIPEPEAEYDEYDEFEEDEVDYGDDPYGDDGHDSAPAPPRRKRSKKKKKPSGGGIPTPVLIIGSVCIATLVIAGALYAVLGDGDGQEDAVAAGDPDSTTTETNNSGTPATQNTGAANSANGNTGAASSGNNSSNNSTSPGVTSESTSRPATTTSGMGNQLWVVVTEFQEQLSPQVIGKTYQVKYRIASGTPDPSNEYVIYVGSSMGIMQRYHEVPVSLQSNGAVTIPPIMGLTGDVEAYVAWKKGHQDWVPVSGKIAVGGEATTAQRPPTVQEAAGASAQGKMFALANARFEKGRIGRNALVVDYVLQAPMQGGKFYFMIITGNNGTPVQADVSRSLRMAKQGDSDKFGVSLMPGSNFPSGPLRVHVELRDTPGRSRIRAQTAKVVSNTVTLQR